MKILTIIKMKFKSIFYRLNIVLARLKNILNKKTSWQFHDLVGNLADDQLPILDQKEIDESALNAQQREYRENGRLIVKGLLPDDLIDEYIKVRSELPEFLDHMAYTRSPEMRKVALYRPLVDIIENLIGVEMAMSLSLSNWKSTQRNWHQDEYLNPVTHCHYLSAWIALEDIDEESGPFEYIKGSHKWGMLERNKILAAMPLGQSMSRGWPSYSESILTPAIEGEMRQRDAVVDRFLAKKGDVLFWHTLLAHRGSVPIDHEKSRKSLIAHYTSASRGLAYMPFLHTDQYGKYFSFKNAIPT